MKTKDIRVQLFELTKMFVYAYQRRYYVQYKGELDDLVSEFFLEFITPKSREDGKEESLLQKFNPSITTLPYLTKVSVIRMLIDRSRSDKREVNYQELYDEKGDFILSKFNIVEQVDDSIESFDPDEVELALYKKAWAKLSEEQRRSIFRSYSEVRCILNPAIDKFLRAVMGSLNDYYVKFTDGTRHKVYQVTEKSIQVFIEDKAEIHTFNKITGEERGTGSICITAKSLNSLIAALNGRNFKLRMYDGYLV